MARVSHSIRVKSMNTRCLMLFVLLASDVANAHHSRAAFNLDSNIEIEGTLVELAWRNPHAFVVVESIDEDGNTMEWTFEGHSIAGLMRMAGPRIPSRLAREW